MTLLGSSWDAWLATGHMVLVPPAALSSTRSTWEMWERKKCLVSLFYSSGKRWQELGDVAWVLFREAGRLMCPILLLSSVLGGEIENDS